MTSKPSARHCPACGAVGSGKFCSACGAPLETWACAQCGGEVRPGARFCANCGAAVTTEAASTKPGAGLPVAPLVVAGAAVVALVGVFLLRDQRTASAGGTPAPSVQAEGPPDLSQMTPREAFDRLYNRVMAAAEQGDTITVAQFSPMALQAYRNLDLIDADARYHAAMLRLHTGDVTGAQALADSILAEHPTHLFGFVLNAAVARFQGSAARERESSTKFLAAWDAEMKAARPEYQDHQRMLEGFRKDAAAKQ